MTLCVIFDVSHACRTGPVYLKNRTCRAQSDASESRQQGIQEAEAKRDRPYEILPDEPRVCRAIMTVSAKRTRSFPSRTSVESRLLPWQCGCPDAG
jgi:hypothetical protein